MGGSGVSSAQGSVDDVAIFEVVGPEHMRIRCPDKVIATAVAEALRTSVHFAEVIDEVTVLAEDTRVVTCTLCQKRIHPEDIRMDLDLMGRRQRFGPVVRVLAPEPN